MATNNKGKEKVTEVGEEVAVEEEAEVSDFILAARDGDVEAVKKGLKEDPPPSEEHLAVALWAAACKVRNSRVSVYRPRVPSSRRSTGRGRPHHFSIKEAEDHVDIFYGDYH